MSGTLFSVEILEETKGYCCLSVTGKQAKQVFANESGGHRFQRVPPTERRGKVQTSTITVATMEESSFQELSIPESDLEYQFTRSGGKGGQNVNKVSSCCILKHLPTGIQIRSESERQQHQNKILALERLKAKLLELHTSAEIQQRNFSRRNQIGSGMRGDKRRTIRYQDGIVTDHLCNVTLQLKDYLRGNLGKLVKD